MSFPPLPHTSFKPHKQSTASTLIKREGSNALSTDMAVMDTSAMSTSGSIGTSILAGLSDACKDFMVGLLWEDIFGEFVTEIMFDVHRRAKIDQRTCQVCHTSCRKYASGVGLDIFGANPSQTNGEKYQCFNCQNLFPSVRFAPHLEKCLGLGRTSSRVASRKIASSERLSSPTPGMNNDSDTDKEFSLEKKKKQRKPSPIRKITLKKAKTG
ncbi:hypothetical protein QVD99_001155 [Batrachochytrium dendrobatidis]|nr:hypothetical protein QVD99_001155 [Batrachochytrium dendrobatidis]